MCYFLSFLKEFLGFGIEVSYRVYVDVLVSYKFFEICLLNLFSYIKMIMDLIDFFKCVNMLIKRFLKVRY